MGTRPVQGILLLCLIFLATSIIQSCYKEPAPVAIDITQPTQQQPPTELWRKAVVTKPPSEAKRDKIMEDHDWDKLAEAEGWTLAQSPILLPDGSVLCVTYNASKNTGEKSNAPDWADSSVMFNSYAIHRLVIVSNKGKIKLHKEFNWDTASGIVPDPTGEYLAFVAQDNSEADCSPGKGASEEKSISVLDFKLNVIREIRVESADISQPSLVATDNSFLWQSVKHSFEDFDIDAPKLDVDDMTYSSEVYCMDRNGSVNWNYKMPEGKDIISLHSFQPVTVDRDGNAYFCHANESVIALNNAGKDVWTRSLDFSFKTQPILLSNSHLALVGDKSHKLEFPDMSSMIPDFESTDSIDTDGWKDDIEKFQDDYDKYQHKLFRLPGILMVLSSEGEVLVEKELPSLPNSGPVVIDDTKLLVNIIGNVSFTSIIDMQEEPIIPSRLMCVSVEGKTLWDKAFDTGFIEGSIQVADRPEGNGKIILAAGDDGNLYALDEAGELLWVISGTGIDPYSLAVGTDGRIYVVDDGGELVCYQLEG